MFVDLVEVLSVDITLHLGVSLGCGVSGCESSISVVYELLIL